MPGRWQAFGQAVVRTVVGMTPSQNPRFGDRAPGVAALFGQLSAANCFPANGFPAAALLEALQVARLLVVTSVTRTSSDVAETGGLLAGLHLDLAAAEIADVSGLGLPDPVGDFRGGTVDAAARSDGRRLVDRCAWVVQERLDHGPGFDAEQMLACTRAVLHLDAARRVWPDGVTRGRAP